MIPTPGNSLLIDLELSFLLPKDESKPMADPILELMKADTTKPCPTTKKHEERAHTKDLPKVSAPDRRIAEKKETTGIQTYKTRL